MLNGIRARVGAGRPASTPKRDFFLEKEPMPEVIPQPEATRPATPEERESFARWCEAVQKGWPSSVEQSADRRELENLYLAACQKLRDVTADRDALEAANGRLVAEVRALRKQFLGGAGIEPAARE